MTERYVVGEGPGGDIARELAENMRSQNPWWTGDEALHPHRFRRWPFERMMHMLKSGMTPATVLRGPRRVGRRCSSNAPFGLLVTLEDDVHVPDPRIVPIPLSSFLWMR